MNSKPLLFRVMAVAAAWFLVALLTSAQYYVAGLASSQRQPWLPSLAFGLVWYGAWAALTPAVVWLARRFPFETGNVWGFAGKHLIAGCVTAIMHVVIYASISSALLLHNTSAAAITDLILLKLGASIHVDLMIYAIIVGLVVAGHAYQSLRDREVAAAQLETRLTEAEIAALRAQLQPHFLFNTLNSISALVPDDPAGAQRLIARLGDLLRLAIEQHPAQQSSLAEEMAFTQAYLAIEEARLGARLKIVRRISPDALLANVPTLLIQPLVENAVRHGIASVVSGGTLTIEAEVHGSAVRITVADDGKGTEA